MSEPSTPLMRQYTAIKKRFPHALLFFRLGDFYELFFEDAVVAARELQITLTSRNKEKGVAIPMCGVPHHAAQSYIAKLIQKGFKVAICDQTEDPRLAKKLVKREVTRVVTPGTAADFSVVPPRDNNYLVAAAPSRSGIGLACVDLSTGEFRATELNGEDQQAKCAEEVAHLGAREILFPSGAPFFAESSGLLAAANGTPGMPGVTRTPVEEWVFGYDYASRLLTEQFRVHSLDGFGLEGRPQAVCAAGALLHYLKETQQGSLAHLDRVSFYERRQWMVLDSVTVRNLELIEPLYSGMHEATLLSVLDRTATSMGARLLKSWMLRPSLDLAALEARLDAVEEVRAQPIALGKAAKELREIQDLERLLSKVTLASATPRDLAGLRNSIAVLLKLLSSCRHSLT